MTSAVLDVDREQVIAYRVAAQELDRSVADPLALAVLDLGVQDTPTGSARLALAARTGTTPGDDTVVVWSVRGAPHLHRRADLVSLASALWPLSDADATARLPYTPIKEGARLGLAAFTAAAQAMHDVVRAPMAKGEVSTAVSARVPVSLTYWCEPCGAQHISGGLFQQVGLPAGVQVLPTGPGTTLAPLDGWPGVPTGSMAAPSIVEAYLRLLGPATKADVARFLGTTVTHAGRAWPDDLVQVRVDGRTGWLPADRAAALRSAPPPRLVRLLPGPTRSSRHATATCWCRTGTGRRSCGRPSASRARFSPTVRSPAPGGPGWPERPHWTSRWSRSSRSTPGYTPSWRSRPSTSPRPGVPATSG